jgi:hypothetical protein
VIGTLFPAAAAGATSVAAPTSSTPPRP